MATAQLQSDRDLVDILRRRQECSVPELGESLGVTATAVRQRLVRLMDDGLVERETMKVGRGRPSHRYRLTPAGEKAAGTNYDDLVAVLWEEIRAIDDPEIRTGLLRRLAKRLAEKTSATEGDSLAERMVALAKQMEQRDVPFEVDGTGQLPVLKALACPYPDLVEKDRSICSVEKMLFSELLGETVRLSECRLEGGSCCSFEPSKGNETKVDDIGEVSIETEGDEQMSELCEEAPVATAVRPIA